MGNVGSQVYNDSAAAGQIFSTFGLIMAVIIGIAMIIGGIVLILRKSKYTSQTIATVLSTSTCIPIYNNNNNTQYQCTLDFTYTVNSQPYNVKGYIITSSVNYTSVSNYRFQIYYDPSNPTNFSITSDNMKVLGIILLIIALIMIGIAFFWFWASRKNKFIASGVGASGVLGLLSGGKLGGIV